MCTDQALLTSQNSAKEFQINILVDFDVRGKQEMDFFTRYYGLWHLDSFSDGTHLLQRISIENLNFSKSVPVLGWTVHFYFCLKYSFKLKLKEVEQKR